MNRPAILPSTMLQDSSAKPELKSSQSSVSGKRQSETPQTGILIINADDWGRDREATDRTLECFRTKALSSVSAMVFMEDSVRGAELALEAGVDAGLHLNLTTPFSAGVVPASLSRHHEKVIGYLTGNRLAQVLFNPGLNRSFQYVVAAQLDEFRRIYRKAPDRIDGHHHMHLCANVLLPGLLPAGTIARRSFSFRPGQKSLVNRLYRQGVDLLLATRHSLTDFFFSLPPMEPASRLQQIFSLARKSVVEVETHPVNVEEHRYLVGGEIFVQAGNLPVAPRYMVRAEERTSPRTGGNVTSNGRVAH